MEVADFLREKKGVFQGKLLFVKLWGSRSHNTHLPHSDWDFNGVYVAPIRHVLSYNVIQTKPIHETYDQETKPDFQIHEIGKFAQLLLKGNPGIVEMLWTDKFTFETTPWLELKEHRKEFLSQKCVNQYLGYAEGQLGKLKKGSYLHTTGGGPNEKWAYHLIRLLWDAKRIAQGGEPVVWKEGVEQEELMRIRNGLVEPKEVVAMAEKELAAIKALYPLPLPHIGNEQLLSEWVVQTRLDELV